MTAASRADGGVGRGRGQAEVWSRPLSTGPPRSGRDRAPGTETRRTFEEAAASEVGWGGGVAGEGEGAGPAVAEGEGQAPQPTPASLS